jgi:hypothetical protein
MGDSPGNGVERRSIVESPLFEIARVLVCLDHVACFIIHANHSMIALEIEPAED